jgi:transcriptional regulator with XRE-family HTH domain
MDADNPLGEFLRARRNQLQPADVGLPAGGRRRVPGLRREELAMLAGISADYYLRIEQGRNEHPSPQVLDALAAALRLNAAATAHLHELARWRDRPNVPGTQEIPEGVATLIDQLEVPAMVVGRVLDVVASNELAQALSPNFKRGRNLLRQLFLDPGERQLHVDWDDATAGVVGGLRQVAASRPTDPLLVDIVNELSARSDDFRMLWNRGDVGYRPDGASHMRHPIVGELHLRRNRFDIPDSDGQHLLVYHAEPGSEFAEKIASLRPRGRGSPDQGQ